MGAQREESGRAPARARCVRVADSKDLREEVPLGVLVFGRPLVLVRSGVRVYALDDVCPHRGGPMHEGEVRDGCLECPLHGWAFSLATGDMEEMPGMSLETFSVAEQDGGIFVEIP